MTFASVGNGTTSHLSGALFKSLAQVDRVHVPYKGSTPAITDFLDGRISTMFDTTSCILDHVKSGKLRALSMTRRDRSPAMPGVPSIFETTGVVEYGAGRL